MNENNTFEYSYSAPSEAERKTIEGIRKSYLSPSERDSKYQRVVKLDRLIKNRAMISSLSAGIFGTLLFGLGMSLILEFNLIVWGAMLSAVGIVPISLAYFLYTYVLSSGKRKYGAEIIRLSDDILNKEDKDS